MRARLYSMINTLNRSDATQNYQRAKLFWNACSINNNVTALLIVLFEAVMGDQLFHISVARLFIRESEIVAKTRGDMDLFNARHFTGVPQHFDLRGVIALELRANLRMHAGELTAFRLDLRTFAGGLIHVRGRAADVTNDAFEAWHLRELTYFLENALR